MKSHWIRFILTRIGGLVVVALAMIVIVFLLRQVVPVDPARAAAGPNAPAEVVEAQRVALGLDLPLHEQFFRYAKDLSQGDLGTSVRTRNPVREDITALLPASIELIIAGVVLAVVIGVAVATVETVVPRAGVFKWLLLIVSSAPAYLLGLVAVYFLWFKWDLLPGGGRSSSFDIPEGPTGLLVLDYVSTGELGLAWDSVRHLILPATVLGTPMAIAIARSLRSSLIAVMRSDHIRTAQSKGLSRRQVVLRHGLRNSAHAPLALAGLYVSLLLANVLLVEQIFGWPGIGLYTTQAIAAADLNAVLGVALVLGFVYIIASIAVEVGQVLADPRLRLN